MKFKTVIEVDTLEHFCGGCNNTVFLTKFVAVDEEQSFEDAWKHKLDGYSDELFKRMRFMGFCLCGNIFLKKP